MPLIGARAAFLPFVLLKLLQTLWTYADCPLAIFSYISKNLPFLSYYHLLCPSSWRLLEVWNFRRDNKVPKKISSPCTRLLMYFKDCRWVSLIWFYELQTTLLRCQTMFGNVTKKFRWKYTIATAVNLSVISESLVITSLRMYWICSVLYVIIKVWKNATRIINAERTWR